MPKGYASDYPGANFLKVVNTLEALQRLAERHRDEFNNIPIVGITGSNGKTMVKGGSTSCSRQACLLPAVRAVTTLR